MKRILVHESIADAFVDALAGKARALSYGDPLDPVTEIARSLMPRRHGNREPMEMARWRPVHASSFRCGARSADSAPACSITRAGASHACGRGDLWTCRAGIRFGSVDEAIALTNGTDFGLCAGLCTDRLDVIHALHRGICMLVV